MKAEDLVQKIEAALSEKKGEAVAVVDVRNLSNVTDYYVVVAGSSPPHLRALYDGVIRRLGEEGVRCYRSSGDAESGWLVVDFVDAVVHIFSREARAYYGIEELWARLKPRG